jgi:hypothetical protein
MQYSIEFPVGGLTFGVAADSVNELLDHFGKMGGDTTWLLQEVQNAAPNLDKVPVVVRATAHPDLDAAETVNPDDDTDSWGRGKDDSPWGASEPAAEPVNDDPWGAAPGSTSKPAQRRSAPSRGNSGGGGSGARISTDPWGGEWTTGLPGAPECDGHGLPAARVKAKSQAGNQYEAWRCALGGPDSDDRSAKCDFFKFAGGNKRK